MAAAARPAAASVAATPKIANASFIVRQPPAKAPLPLNCCRNHLTGRATPLALIVGIQMCRAQCTTQSEGTAKTRKEAKTRKPNDLMRRGRRRRGEQEQS